MGLELKKCVALIKDVRTAGTLHVDSKELQFRAKELNWTVKVGKGTRCKVLAGNLTVSRGAKSATFEIGEQADRWADKVLHPPSRATKLGLKPESNVFIKGGFDPQFKNELQAEGLKSVRSVKSCDIVFLKLESVSELKHFDQVAKSSAIGTHIWAVWPKGIQDIRQSEVIAKAREHGMGPGKGIAFDEVHSAMRFTKK